MHIFTHAPTIVKKFAHRQYTHGTQHVGSQSQNNLWYKGLAMMHGDDGNDGDDGGDGDDGDDGDASYIRNVIQWHIL